jgi:hypothetical protein
MVDMFNNAGAYNNGGKELTWSGTPPISNSMIAMFLEARSFNQNIGSWSLSSIVAPGLENMLDNSGLSIANYDATLNGWVASDPPSGLILGASGLYYSGSGLNAYNILTNTYNWTIQDNGFIIIPCFKEGSKILTDKGYIPIQDLKKGDLIKTLKNDYQPIIMIGKREIYHPASQERIKQQLYKCSQSEYKELFEPLIITGCHSILVDNFINEKQKQKVIEVNGNIFVTEKKYRLPACADPRASVYETPGYYNIYHIALENDNYYFNYGIYANGLLVETCSKRYLKELSNMTLIE